MTCPFWTSYHGLSEYCASASSVGWVVAATGSIPTGVVAMASNSGTLVLVSTYPANTINVSTDTGASWTTTHTVSIGYTLDRILRCGTYWLNYCSEDGPYNTSTDLSAWTTIDFHEPRLPSYASGSNFAYNGVVACRLMNSSADYGTTYIPYSTTINAAGTTETIYDGIAGSSDERLFSNMVVLGSTFVCVDTTNVTLFVSTDDGATWTESALPFALVGYSCFLVSSGSQICLFTGHHAYITTNGATWSTHLNVFSYTPLYGFYNGSAYVVVKPSSSSQGSVSLDGISWSNAAAPTGFGVGISMQLTTGGAGVAYAIANDAYDVQALIRLTYP